MNISWEAGNRKTYRINFGLRSGLRFDCSDNKNNKTGPNDAKFLTGVSSNPSSSEDKRERIAALTKLRHKLALLRPTEIYCRVRPITYDEYHYALCTSRYCTGDNHVADLKATRDVVGRFYVSSYDNKFGRLFFSLFPIIGPYFRITLYGKSFLITNPPELYNGPNRTDTNKFKIMLLIPRESYDFRKVFAPPIYKGHFKPRLKVRERLVKKIGKLINDTESVEIKRNLILSFWYGCIFLSTTTATVDVLGVKNATRRLIRSVPVVVKRLNDTLKESEPKTFKPIELPAGW